MKKIFSKMSLMMNNTIAVNWNNITRYNINTYLAELPKWET